MHINFIQDERKVAFIAPSNFGDLFANVGDYKVYEEHHVGDVKFLHTASFILSTDAKAYLKSKYPTAVIE